MLSLRLNRSEVAWLTSVLSLETLSGVDRFQADRLLLRLAPRKAPAKKLPFPTRKESKSEKRRVKAQKTASVRAAIMERANGVCEACLQPEQPWNPLEYDHFFGRTKKGAREVDAGWGIHAGCHREKTRNFPTRKFWLEMFRAHLKRNQLPIPREIA